MSIGSELKFNEGDIQENISPNLMELSMDLSAILEQGVQSDILLRVIGNEAKDIKCHKAILCSRSKWFSQKIRQAHISKTNIMTINEKNHVMNAVLTYIYTGNLKSLESLSIPLIDLHQAAERYCLTGLKAITDLIIAECLLDKTKSTHFLWNVEVDCNNSNSCVCPSLTNFNLHGNDKWGFEIQPVMGDGPCVSEIYLMSEIENVAHNTIHIATINISIVNSTSTTPLFSGEMVISQNGKYKIFGISLALEQTDNTSKTMVTLSCELTVCSKVVFQLKGILRRHISNELFTLSHDMHDMLKNRLFTDINIKKAGNANLIQLHSYIVFGRSRMPIPVIAKLGDVADYEGETWRSFICFLYTGQSRYLDDHVRVVYNAFRKFNLTESALKYEIILAKNLNLTNAFGILCDSVNGRDYGLAVSAAQFLARFSGILSEPGTWLEIASDHLKRAMYQNRFSFC